MYNPDWCVEIPYINFLNSVLLTGEKKGPTQLDKKKKKTFTKDSIINDFSGKCLVKSAVRDFNMAKLF